MIVNPYSRRTLSLQTERFKLFSRGGVDNLVVVICQLLARRCYRFPEISNDRNGSVGVILPQKAWVAAHGQKRSLRADDFFLYGISVAGGLIGPVIGAADT